MRIFACFRLMGDPISVFLQCYQTIQEAVNNSSGLVIIHSGTYKESLEINKPVTLLGAGKHCFLVVAV